MLALLGNCWRCSLGDATDDVSHDVSRMITSAKGGGRTNRGSEGRKESGIEGRTKERGILMWDRAGICPEVDFGLSMRSAQETQRKISWTVSGIERAMELALGKGSPRDGNSKETR